MSWIGRAANLIGRLLGPHAAASWGHIGLMGLGSKILPPQCPVQFRHSPWPKLSGIFLQNLGKRPRLVRFSVPVSLLGRRHLALETSPAAISAPLSAPSAGRSHRRTRVELQASFFRPAATGPQPSSKAATFTSNNSALRRWPSVSSDAKKRRSSTVEAYRILDQKGLPRVPIPMGDDISRKQRPWRAEEAVAGNARALQALRELIIYPIVYSREARILGLKWPRGLLLYGPPGTGKTSLVRAVVKESDAHLTLIRPQSVHKAHAGESEKFLREAFAEAYSQASSGKPSVIFIDEIDAICPHRDSRREHEARIVGQLLTLMDGSNASSKSLPHVAIVASTNRVDGVDPALRRPGRFDSEIEVTIPTAEERLQILELHTRKLHLDNNVDLQAIAASCNGYVGADLEGLCREAAMSAWQRSPNMSKGGDTCMIQMEDWEYARAEVRPSITRGITKEVSKVTWDDIGGLKDLKKKLQQAVEWPIKHADAFARLRISPVRGILLHGPPGCSKTTLAKAAAHAAQAAFFSLSGAELYSKYVGEGEALLRRTFQKARHSAPSIIFFDEADAIAPK
ncbi:hypothetical protein Taro_005268, partial [Colocasia esculenta]|nr:hypothetical protein [Colocasia esculenta]